MDYTTKTEKVIQFVKEREEWLTNYKQISEANKQRSQICQTSKKH